MSEEQVKVLNATLNQVPTGQFSDDWDAAGKTGTWQFGDSETQNAPVWTVGYTRFDEALRRFDKPSVTPSPTPEPEPHAGADPEADAGRDPEADAASAHDDHDHHLKAAGDHNHDVAGHPATASLLGTLVPAGRR